MKISQGYLLDRETGDGISGKDVFFEKLDGSPVTSSDTGGYADLDSATDADGFFAGRMELSPGPVITRIDVDGIETKVRQWNEMAPFGGGPWGSDLRLLSRIAGDGVIDNYLNELAVSTPAGHTIRVATGAAVFNGGVFSIENGQMDIAGTANPSGPANPRIDLITMRQYNNDAPGQDAGRQAVIVTEGSASNVAPGTPTGATFVDKPLATVSTAQGASSKTLHQDLRTYVGQGGDLKAPLYFEHLMAASGEMANTAYQNWTLAMTGLSPGAVYDGEIDVNLAWTYGAASSYTFTLRQAANYTWIRPTLISNRTVGYATGGSATNTGLEMISFRIPIVGLTGVTSQNFLLQLQVVAAGSGVSSFIFSSAAGSKMQAVLRPR